SRAVIHSLCLTARELGRGLAQTQITDAHLSQDLKRAKHLRFLFEEVACLVDRQRQNLCDVLAPIANLQRLAVVAGAVAGGAGGEDARQENELDADKTLALAGLAPTFRDVE